MSTGKFPVLWWKRQGNRCFSNFNFLSSLYPKETDHSCYLQELFEYSKNYDHQKYVSPKLQ